MSRRDRIPNPGAAGIIALVATALLPIAVKKFRPMARWVGKKLHAAAERVDKIADEVERSENERQAREPRANPTVKPSERKVKDANESTETPASNTASPHSQPEVEAQKVNAKASGSGSKASPTKPRQKMAGATPPSNNPKRIRKKPG